MLQRDPFNPFPRDPRNAVKERRKGYFEITYAPVKPGKEVRGLAIHCLEAPGFMSAKEIFENLGLGEFCYTREISEEAFQAWSKSGGTRG